MPFGLVNAPAVFQKMVNELANKMNHGEIVTYLDDIIIPSVTVQEGFERLERFLKILRRTGLTVRTSKCVFLAKELNFLGHKVSKNGIMPGTQKVESIQGFSIPKNITEVRRFLGLCGFFRKFIEHFSIITLPLTKLLKKTGKFVWSNEQNEAFETLKLKLTSKPILRLYDPKCNHEVHTDASSVGLAGILMQDDENGNWGAVFYYSRKCTDAEMKYHSYELEVLAIVEALERFRVYVLGKFFRVVTDCSAVSTVKLTKPLLPRVQRWLLKLQEYDLEIIHRSASKLRHADALSRAPYNEPNEVDVVTENIMLIDVSEEDWLSTMQQQDPKLSNIIKVLKGEKTSEQEKQFRSEYKLIQNRLYRRRESGQQWVVPGAIRWRIVKNCHDDAGHFGLEKTIKRIQQDYWFPRMRCYVKQYIAACIDCCLNKKQSFTSGSLRTVSEKQKG